MTVSVKAPTSTTGSIQLNGSDVLTIESDNSVDIDSGTLHVDAANNRVGVGTSSPTVKLDVNGVVGGSGSGFNPGTTAWVSAAFKGTGSYGGGISFVDGSNGATIYAGGTNLIFGNGATSGGTLERMRISSTGNLLVGTTSGYDGGGGHTFKSPTNNFITTWRTTTSTGNYIHAFVSDVGGSGTAKYAIYANGTAGAISDENYKKNIELARDYLSDINQINIIKYNWKTDEEDANKEIGFSAQQVETIFPTMVDTVTASLEDGSEITHKMLKKDVFLPMAIKCIQELSAKIEALETRIEALEAK